MFVNIKYNNNIAHTASHITLSKFRSVNFKFVTLQSTTILYYVSTSKLDITNFSFKELNKRTILNYFQIVPDVCTQTGCAHTRKR